MLESLAAERTVHDRHRNLIVAATGTGKTVIAALDYRSLCDPDSRTDRHCCSWRTARRSWTNRSRTYREVLADASFGELYVGGSRPERWKHVFASVQSLHSYGVGEPPGRRLRDRRHRRVPPRRGRDLPSPPRPPATAGAARAHRHPGTRRRRRRPVVLRRPHRRRAAAVGRAERRTADARSTTSASRTAPTCSGIQWTRGGYDLGSLSNVYTGNDARARDRAAQPARQGHRRRRACGRWDSACPSRTPTTWPGCFVEAGVPARCGDGRDPAGPTARRPCWICATGGSTCCSLPTCSTRASTCPASTPCCSSGPPKARRSSCSNSAADCGSPRTSRC